ncbi:DUF308 domain-containing protein [Pseudoduganella plicata]|uniref:DUF308 domain-containing protein n=1 Tax=Pseudoduganella plicata TaxID=321984 RepID=A0A4P7BG27_9BURK|nr:DUF308 domain-containing protein [Pseudoduganella plicata]QBQ37152.1 DUF308 domain-containing protein [Pseudoduganella plicata]GGY98914.1 membrane protein [Pseudoduganella plicata]
MDHVPAPAPLTRQDNWLKRYYFMRATVSFAWVAAMLALAPRSASAAAVLLVCYPAWDALANFADSRRSGELAASRTQLLNVIVSIAVVLALIMTLPDMNRVLGVFGVWAILSGLLQLGTALRRWKAGAQWAMVLSGAQSALAGTFFILQARGPAVPPITTVVGYAGFGAFYFLVSAVALSISGRRRQHG